MKKPIEALKSLHLIKQSVQSGMSIKKAIMDVYSKNKIVKDGSPITHRTYEGIVYSSGMTKDIVKKVAEKPIQKDAEAVDLHSKLKAMFRKGATATDIISIANKVDASPQRVLEVIEDLKNNAYNIEVSNNSIIFGHGVQKSEPTILDIKGVEGMSVHHHKYGLIGDNHLCSKYSRLDVLDAAYKTFKEEGVKTVFNTGNWIDGEARFNKTDLLIHGMGNQVSYFVDRYPSVEGITTKFISGDDHEGWYNQREGINIGQYAQMIAEKNGRNDLVHLGYMEHDIIFKAENGETRMRIQHPGGGSAYAFSYQPQKIVESLTGGEKPHILALGHYHKHSYDYIRGVHTVQTGCTMDQSPFMRKKRLAAHVGFVIIEFWTDPNGAVTRFKHEWFPFYDSEYYKNWSYQW